MNDKLNGSVRTVVMWGATQVGKTTALATYVCERTPSWLDFQEETTLTTVGMLAGTWNLLRQNRLPEGTGSVNWFDFRDSSGRLVRFRDMKGGDALRLDDKSHRDDLASAVALMVFVSWPGEHDVANLVAAENALRVFSSGAPRPMVLVITKVECFLTPEQVGVIATDPRVCKEMQSGSRHPVRVPE